MKIAKGKKGTAEVDREFLKEIESWVVSPFNDLKEKM